MKKILLVGTPYFIDKHIGDSVPKNDDTETEIYFGEELKKDEFFAYVNSVSLFGNRKFAVIRNASKISDSEDFIKNLATVSETVIVATMEQTQSKTDDKVIKSFKASGFELVVDSFGGEATSHGVMKIFKEKGMSLSPINANYVLNLAAGDMVAVENEAEKIALFLHSNNNMTADNVMEHVAGQKEEKIYLVTSNFAKKNAKEAANMYKFVQNSSENNMFLFFGLSKFLINLYYSYIDPSLADTKTQFQRNLLDNRRFWSREDVASMISLMAELDLAVKTGKTGLREAIETVLLHPLAEKK